MAVDNRANPPGWYYRLGDFFRRQLGGPVYKIPLDAGFSCPNRDGMIGTHGCIYCHNPAFSPYSGREQPLSIAEQIARGKRKSPAGKYRYLAYFQAYTNTYAPVEKLRALYETALADPEIAGLSVATRPDCVSDQVLDLLATYARRYHVWVEYGLQSAHDQTLQRIRRGHTYAQFAEAVQRTRHRGIFICAHIILGLPEESPDMMLATVDRLNECRVDGVKFHHLQVFRDTPLAAMHARDEVALFNSLEEYLPVLCDCLERLSPRIVVHRLAAQAADNRFLVAPRWRQSGGQVAAAVTAELKRRGSCQGILARSDNALR